MSYLVLIERIGQNGIPTGQPLTRNVPTEKEALIVMRGAALDAQKAHQQMLLSLYDESKGLLVSYASGDRGLAPTDARAE